MASATGGEKSIKNRYKKLSELAAEAGASVSAAFSEQMSAAEEEITDILKNTTAEAKSKVAKIAGVYRRAGKTLSESFRLAWADVKEYMKSGVAAASRLADGMEAAGANAGGSFAEGIALGAAAGFLGLRTAAVSAAGVCAALFGKSLSDAERDMRAALSGGGDAIEEFAKNAASSFGLSAEETVRYASVISSSLVGLGAGIADAENLGVGIAKRAGEIAPLFEMSNADAFLLLRRAIEGDAEAASSLGVAMDEAALSEFAAASGAGEAYGKMSALEKAILRLDYVMAETSEASEAFAAGQASMAYQARSLLANVKSLAATLGQGLMNVFAPAAEAANAFVSILRDAAGSFRKFTAEVFGDRGTVPSASVSQLESVADAIDDTSSAAENAEKSFGGYLSGLDELRRFPDDISPAGSVGDAAVGDDGGGGLKLSFDADFSGVERGGIIFDKLRKKAEGVLKVLTSAAESFGKGFSGAFARAGSSLGGIAEASSEVFRRAVGVFSSGDVAEAAAGFASSFTRALGSAAGAAAGIGASIAKNLTEGARTCLEENGERLKSQIVGAFDVGTRLSASAEKLISDISGIFSQIGSGAAEKITSTVMTAVTDVFFGAVSFVGEGASSIIETVTSVFRDSREALTSSAAGLLNGLGKAVDGIGGIVRFVTDTVLPGLTAAFGSLLGAVRPLADFLVGAFASALGAVVTPALSFVGDAATDLKEIFSALWRDVITPLAAFLGGAFSTAVSAVSSVMTELWQKILVPAGKFVTGVFTSAWKTLAAFFEEVLIPVFSAIADAMSYLRKNVAEPLAAWLGKQFSPTLSAVFGSVGEIVDGLRKTLTGLLDFLTSVFRGDWKSAWESIKKAFGGVWDTLVGVVKTPINLIIGLINGMLAGIADGVNAVISAVNKMSFEVPDWVPVIGGETFGFDLQPMTAAQIPYLAKGAVIPPNAPFAAVLGDQRRGVNIEAPLETIKDAVRGVLRESAVGGNATYTFIGQIDRRTLFEEMMTEAELKRGRSGRNPFEMA